MSGFELSRVESNADRQESLSYYHPRGRHLRGTTGATLRVSSAENFFSQIAREVGSTAVIRSAANTSAGARPGSSADFNPYRAASAGSSPSHFSVSSTFAGSRVSVGKFS